MYFTYTSFRAVFNVLFTLFFLGLLVYSLITGYFFQYTLFYMGLIIFCILLFPIVEPFIIYMKIVKRLKLNNETNTILVFYDDKYIVKKNDKEVNVEYDKIYNIKKYSKLVILFYNTIQGQLIPDRAFLNNKQQFYDFIITKINGS